MIEQMIVSPAVQQSSALVISGVKDIAMVFGLDNDVINEMP